MDLYPRARGFGLMASAVFEVRGRRAVVLKFTGGWGGPLVFPFGEGPRVRSTWAPLSPVVLVGGVGMSGSVASCRGSSVSVGRVMAVRRVWSGVESRFTGDVFGLGGVRVCWSIRGPISYVGRVYCGLLSSVRVVEFGDFGLWCPELIPVCLASFVGHPV